MAAVTVSDLKRRSDRRVRVVVAVVVQAVWLMKVRALTGKNEVDDTADVEEEGVADLLMDENAMAKAPRPGTSLRPQTGSKSGAAAAGGLSASVRPMSSSGRPLSGFARPGTQSRYV